jgi:hypothetical protein
MQTIRIGPWRPRSIFVVQSSFPMEIKDKGWESRNSCYYHDGMQWVVHEIGVGRMIAGQ